MYFFRTLKKSIAPYKVHNMGLRYIKYILSYLNCELLYNTVLHAAVYSALFIPFFLLFICMFLKQCCGSGSVDPHVFGPPGSAFGSVYCFVTSVWLFIFEEWCKCTNAPDAWDPYVFGPPGSAYGSVSQRYGSEGPDPHPVRTVPKCHGSQHWILNENPAEIKRKYCLLCHLLYPDLLFVRSVLFGTLKIKINHIFT